MNIFRETVTSGGFDLATLVDQGADRAVAGIGSRETPDLVLQFMTAVMRALAERGWTLRSGGAPGADQACEAGYAAHRERAQIFLPWKGFEGSKSPFYPPYIADGELQGTIEHLRGRWEPKLLTGRESPTNVVANAYLLAEHFHPAWNRVTPGAKKLQSRNGHQMLGLKLDDPSDLVVAWTVDGEATGGTGQAIRIADHFGIPVVNLKRERDLEALVAALGITGWDLRALLTAPPVRRTPARR
jgi:hypothetical protein